MPDPIEEIPTPQIPELPFESASRQAGRVAARYAKVRYRQILTHLRDVGPSCIFEIAAALGCLDHQISGRFSALVKDGLIFRTGHRRLKPDTGCHADVYEISTIGIGILHSAPAPANPDSTPVQTPLEGGSKCP